MFPNPGDTFETMYGLGGAMRLFVAVLWLSNTQLINNSAQTVAGALFFNQSCLGVSSLCSNLLAASSRNMLA